MPSLGPNHLVVYSQGPYLVVIPSDPIIQVGINFSYTESSIPQSHADIYMGRLRSKAPKSFLLTDLLINSAHRELSALSTSL